MFQYAAGRALAAKWDTELYLDLGWFGDATQKKVITQRTYELSVFRLSEHTPLFFDSALDKFSRKIGLKPNIVTYIEPYYHYDSCFEDLTNNTLIDGYWQTSRYFCKISDRIRSDFSFVPNLSEANQKLLDKIHHSMAVSLHVRRGDYANNQTTNAFHGLVGLEYYKTAVAEMSKHLKKPVFYIFSDDIDWCRENLATRDEMVYVTGNTGQQSFEDMRLMSACKHHILANSSFSWWGAWLNPNPKKRVIAPLRWFNEPTKSTKDLIPKDWIRL